MCSFCSKTKSVVETNLRSFISSHYLIISISSVLGKSSGKIYVSEFLNLNDPLTSLTTNTIEPPSSTRSPSQ